jgi:hypothetical protein
MSNPSSTAAGPEPSHQGPRTRDWTQFWTEYAVSRSNLKNSLPVTEDEPSMDIRRKILRRLTLMDDCVERLSRHEGSKLGVFSAAIPLSRLAQPATWSVVPTNRTTNTGSAPPQTAEVDLIKSYRALRTTLSRAWLESYGDVVFDTPRKLKESVLIDEITLNTLSGRVLTHLCELPAYIAVHDSVYVEIDLLAWTGQVRGGTFGHEYEALNLRPAPGSMDYYLGRPRINTDWYIDHADCDSASHGFLPGGAIITDADLQERAWIEQRHAQHQMTAAEDNLFLPPGAAADVTVPTSALDSLTI